MSDSVDQLVQAFAVFTREVLGLDERGAAFPALVSRLRALRQQLETVLVEHCDDRNGTVLDTLIRSETQGLDLHLSWLEGHATTGDRRELMRLLMAAGHQGWTIAELLQNLRTSPLLSPRALDR